MLCIMLIKISITQDFSNDIFRKIDRHFRGYGNIRLYEEW